MEFKNEVIKIKGKLINCPVENGIRYIAITPICNILGIDPANQRKVITEHPIFGSCKVFNTSQEGRNLLYIEFKHFFGWLFGIHPNKVKTEVKEDLIKYQEAICDILFEKFVIQPQFEKLKVEAKIEKLNEIENTKALLKEQNKDFKMLEDYSYEEFKENKMQLKIDF